MSEHNLFQVFESIRNISNSAARNEERLNNVLAEQTDIKKGLTSLEDRVRTSEVKFESLFARLGGHDAKWNAVMDLLWKVALMAIAGYLLYALGLQSDLAFPPS